MKTEAHKHFFIAENRQWFPNHEFIIHLAEPRCFIRIDPRLGDMFTTFEKFEASILQLEWIDGKPSAAAAETVIQNAYDFLGIEDEILELSLIHI